MSGNNVVSQKNQPIFDNKRKEMISRCKSANK